MTVELRMAVTEVKLRGCPHWLKAQVLACSRTRLARESQSDYLRSCRFTRLVQLPKLVACTL